MKALPERLWRGREDGCTVATGDHSDIERVANNALVERAELPFGGVVPFECGCLNSQFLIAGLSNREILRLIPPGGHRVRSGFVGPFDSHERTGERFDEIRAIRRHGTHGPVLRASDPIAGCFVAVKNPTHRELAREAGRRRGAWRGGRRQRA